MADIVSNFADVYKAASTLSREDRQTLERMLNDQLKSEVRRSFFPGDKVKFQSRNGAMIEGIVIRVNQKTVKVSSKMDKYGHVASFPMTWIVAPQFVQAA